MYKNFARFIKLKISNRLCTRNVFSGQKTTTATTKIGIYIFIFTILFSFLYVIINVNFI